MHTGSSVNIHVDGREVVTIADGVATDEAPSFQTMTLGSSSFTVSVRENDEIC